MLLARVCDFYVLWSTRLRYSPSNLFRGDEYEFMHFGDVTSMNYDEKERL